MKILVTGAAGQVGSHVVDALLARGDAVCGIDNFATGREVHVAKHENYIFINHTIGDSNMVKNIFQNFSPNVVVHTAASYKDPDDWMSDTETNIIGMLNLINESKKLNLEKFIYFQTALIYGVKPDSNPISLDHPRRVNNSSYSISKGAAEDYLYLSGLDYVTFRLANVIGDRCVSGPLPLFYQRLGQGKKCFVTPARRDFVFVDDLVSAVIKAIDGTGKGEYHFSSGSDIPIIDLYNAVAKSMGLKKIPEPEFRALTEDDAPSILLDPTRTFEDFGQIEFTSLEKTVEAAIHYYNEFGAIGGYTHLKSDD